MNSTAHTPSIRQRRYAIITNPASGGMTVDEKRSALATAAAILDAKIHGLDTLSVDDLSRCARELAKHCDVLVVAGGDGTVSDMINAIDTTRTPIAFLPLGTGNAMQYALRYRGTLADMAWRIRLGRIYEYDLIRCDNKKRAFMASVGIEGTIIRLRDQYRARGVTGFKAYSKAVLDAYFKAYRPATATITVDGAMFEVRNLLSLMVVKQPYYGFGMKVVPKARFDDRRLHILCINAEPFKSVMGGVTAFTIGNRFGQYCTGRRVTVKMERPTISQIDGNEGRTAETFTFTVLPKALKIKC